MDTRKFYLTTPIFYASGGPHIGHAYTTLVCDSVARYHRMLGEDVRFLTGTDEHGQKIERSAAQAGISPKEFTNRISAEYRQLWDQLGIRRCGTHALDGQHERSTPESALGARERPVSGDGRRPRGGVLHPAAGLQA